MRRRRWLIVGGLTVLAAGVFFAYWFDLIPLLEVEDGDFPMQPVSAITECDRSKIQYLAQGKRVWWKAAPDKDVVWVAKDTHWKTLPDKDVKHYPKLVSSRALYGAVEFGKSPVEPGVGMRFCFVLDESAGTGKGFDRLYFDANRDLDLTNDPVLQPMENPPTPSDLMGGWGQSIIFRPLSIPFDFGPEYGRRPVEVLPRFHWGDDRLSMYFVATEARKGRIQIGRRRYSAVLAQQYQLTGRYDNPYTALYLTAARGGPTWQHWLGADEISSFRLVDGRFYTICATPTGDTLMVRRYRGDVGVLRLDRGARQIEGLSIRGSLRSKAAIVPVGKGAYWSGYPDPVEDCELPVGDYHPEFLVIRYGGLQMVLSNNYHVDGKRQGAMNRQAGTFKAPVYGIKIRKDQPYLFDFSNKPDVMFASPAKEQAFHRGDEVAIYAVLIDPVLNTMIRELDDTSRKEPPRTDSAGRPETGPERDLSLAPVVAITDSSGKKVSEGKMPFG